MRGWEHARKRITNSPDFTIDQPGQPPKSGWGVRVVRDEITACEPNARLLADHPEDEVWLADGQVLAPGLVNSHTHLYGVLAHGIPIAQAPSGFWPFLADFWWPMVEDRLDHSMIDAATDYGCLEMLHGGTTTFYDCLEGPYSLPGCLGAQAEIVRNTELRGILSFEATERVSRDNGQIGLHENLQFIQHCRKSDGLLSGMICFHTTFTCSAAFIQQACGLAAEEGALVHAHCAEGTYEPQFTLQEFGQRPIAYYDRLGVLAPNMLLSQCVQIDPSEVALLAERRARSSHMPLSNCEVGGGIAPAPDLVAAGVRLGLGSDGYINDFYEVMRGTFLIHKAVRQDPRIMPASQVWYLATEGGAQALGLANVGRLAPGWQADLQLIDGALPTPATVDNLYEQLLLYRNRSHVRAVLVAGQVRVRNGQVLGADEAQVRARCGKAAQKLWGAVQG